MGRIYLPIWKWLTRRTMRSGVAYLYMKYELASEFDKCCADAELRRKLGIELFTKPQ